MCHFGHDLGCKDVPFSMCSNRGEGFGCGYHRMNGPGLVSRASHG